MKIYDISQELTECAVFPGDKSPEKEVVSDIKKGDLYNYFYIFFGGVFNKLIHNKLWCF